MVSYLSTCCLLHCLEQDSTFICQDSCFMRTPILHLLIRQGFTLIDTRRWFRSRAPPVCVGGQVSIHTPLCSSHLSIVIKRYVPMFVGPEIKCRKIRLPLETDVIMNIFFVWPMHFRTLISHYKFLTYSQNTYLQEPRREYHPRH